MLSYKLYYNIVPTYLCELISRIESPGNTRLGADHHQLISPPISKDCSNTILKRQILINSGGVLKQCYLHNNMDAD